MGMKICNVDDCDREVAVGKAMCGRHLYRLRAYGSLEGRASGRQRRSAPPQPATEGTYVDNGYVRQKGSGRYMHRVVMERKLGRPLLRTENVHHKDGNRQNNDLSNLELWSTLQPPGQRVLEKVEWAVEILLRYAPEFLREDSEIVEPTLP